ncbi:Dip2/Utp12 family-domain-containing protein [Nemania abortiva]|nr:Dip2/Utp12 family-domain-containing protein [Nemania abortiva]
MSTKRKAAAKIAHPVVRQSASKALKPQINESEAAVSVAGASNTDNNGATDAIIEISSDPESSEYEFSDHELGANDNTQPKEKKSAVQMPTEPLPQKHNDNISTDIAMADSNIPNDAESDQELAQPTLGELARAHGTIHVPSALTPQSNAAATQGRSVATPSLSSLGTVLSQALRTDDADLLESCLRVTNMDTIENTVRRLDSTLAGRLLVKLASRMHRRPGRAASLLTWIQATLVCHGGAFAAQPGLVKSLSELQRVLDERARGLNSLLALRGKLELMSAQLRFRQGRWGSEAAEKVQEEEEEQGIVWVEGEESDAEMANGLMDMDDDELPVTNGLMDEDSEDDDLQSEASEDEEELDGKEELDEDDVDHEDVDSEEEDSEGEAGPEPPSKRSKPSRGR